MKLGQLGKPLPPHGDRRRYMHRLQPCRCDECRAAANEYSRLYRRQRPRKPRVRREMQHELPGCPLCGCVGQLSTARQTASCENDACRVNRYSTKGT